MPVARYLGYYTLLRGGLYFLSGAFALIYGIGSIATGVVAELGPAIFGVLYLAIAFMLFTAAGLLIVERKIGRLLALLVLAIDVLLQGGAVLTSGSPFASLWVAMSLVVIAYLLVRNPLASGDGRTIDEESNAHDIGVEEF